MRPTVLIVDDHADFRASASELLEAEGFDVVGAAADAGRAVELALRLRPQIVLLDVQLPERDGFAVAERLAEEFNFIRPLRDAGKTLGQIAEASEGGHSDTSRRCLDGHAGQADAGSAG